MQCHTGTEKMTKRIKVAALAAIIGLRQLSAQRNILTAGTRKSTLFPPIRSLSATDLPTVKERTH